MDMFIYVFDTAARDSLSRAGFLLLKSDERNGVWTFHIDEEQHGFLEEADFDYFVSGTLTF